MAEESMKDYEQELEESYKMMGDGEKDTDALMAWQKIQELFEEEEILTLEVSGVVKGGVIVMIEGVRGFIPASKLSLQRVTDLNEWLGKEVRVRIITADQEKDKLVLSARELLQEERKQQRALQVAEIKVGSVVEGTVDSIKEYGAFVDLGNGVSGLLHISQIAKERIKHPSEKLKEGETITVKVISNKDGKIGLSIRALLEESNCLFCSRKIAMRLYP